MKTNLLLSIFIFISIDTFAQMQFVAPKPGSKYQNPGRNIILRPGETLDLKTIKPSLFRIVGSQSGVHDFTVHTALDNRTIILEPDHPFSNDEEVTVSLEPGLKESGDTSVRAYQFSFFIKRKYSPEEQKRIDDFRQRILEDDFGNASPQYSLAKNPSSSYYQILVNNNPASGDLFFSNWSNLGSPTNRWWIVNNSGDSVYSTPVAFDPFLFDLNHNGYITGWNARNFSMLDSNYVTIKSFGAVNGYPTDLHEFQIFPDGHYYLFGDDDEIVDMTQYDSSYQSDATVQGNVIQEFDANNNLIFEWRTFDYFAVTEAIHENLANGFIDATHSNSLAEDVDGNIVVSFRKMDQVDKIDIHSGDLIWRLGGQKNQFNFVNDSAQFNYQHDARLLSNGHLTLFDNNVYGSPNYAYAKEYKLNTTAKKATLVWSYTHPPINNIPMTSFGLGSVQRLSNGNTLICWGKIPYSSGFPNATEIDPQNNIVWEIQYTPENYDIFYRTLRHEWSPCARPSDGLLSTSNITSTSAELNWNAATGAVKYDIEYQKFGAANWTSVKVGVNKHSYNLTGLKTSTNYHWHIKTYCTKNGSTQSNFSTLISFKTMSTRLEQPDNGFAVTVFPNPAHEVLHIDWSLYPAESDNIQARLSDNLGRVIKEWQLINDASSHEISLDGIPPGYYFLQFITDGGSHTIKVIIQ